MKNLLLILILTLITCSCKRSYSIAEYKEGKQILNINDKSRSGEKLEPINLKVLRPDSIRLMEQVLFKVFIPNSNYKLVKGFFDCNISENSLIDTITYKVNNCSKEFLIQNDTLFIAFKPQNVGKQKFGHEIIGISKSIDGLFRYHKEVFEYEVKNNYNKRHYKLLTS